MAKNSVRDFDATAANNTDIQSVDIAENCAPSGINNAIRELMADIKNVSTGTIALESPQADSLTVTGDLTVDTNTLYVDSTNNRVGVGTVSPNKNLEIKNSTSPTIRIGDGTRHFEVLGGSTTQTAGIGTAYNSAFTFNINSTEKARLDSSGNLLVGTTDLTQFNNSGASPDTGVVIAGTSYIDVSRVSNPMLYLNRCSTDGQIVNFSKDGTSVGSIGVASSELYFSSGNTGLYFDDVNNLIRPTNNAGGLRDNIADLGKSDSRFKDLYLGGGVRLGGTAAANSLDHYEEGTWTPSVSVGSVSYSEAKYTRIGRVTHVSAYLNNFTNRTSSSTVTISGIPIVADGYASQGVMYQYIAGSGDAVTAYLSDGGSAILLYSTVSGGGYDSISHSQLNSSSANVFLSLTYVV